MKKDFKLSDKSNGPVTDGAFRPQITSLIDVMTILLVFLLKSFSVEGELVTPCKDLQLPLSTSKKPAKPVLSIEITKSNLLLEGKLLNEHGEFKGKDILNIPVLYERIILEKDKVADSTAGYDVMIQADRDVKFNIVKRVMFTCSKAGFSDFSVLTIEEE